MPFARMNICAKIDRVQKETIIIKCYLPPQIVEERQFSRGQGCLASSPPQIVEERQFSKLFLPF